MSESCQKTTAKAIPTTRLVTINDEAHLPHDYSTTPGGTLFSTTPGGTRIIYDRKFLLERRSSPMARTPPLGLPNIPGVTSPRDVREKTHIRKPLINNNNNSIIIITTADGKTGDDAQFEMDI